MSRLCLWSLSRRARTSRRHLALSVFLPVVLFTWLTCSAAQSADVERVEEDWELVLDVVSEAKHAPQFETLMSPNSGVSGKFGRITWNYQEQPDFVPGGFQLQSWNHDFVVSTLNCDDRQLNIAGETLHWTQTMAIEDGQLVFRIKNGQSTTWGTFGSDGTKVSIRADGSELNAYDTNVSVQRSGVTYGGNRVILLRIKEVRRYDASGQLISTDTNSWTILER